MSKDESEKLKLYKYAGGDLGLLYRYFYNPVACWLVEWVPRWVAPNVLTFLGWMCTVVPCVYLFGWEGSDFSSPTPPWFSYMSGVCYLVYRVLDEMDGKQARRTGNSSPLGLLFDHGCDAFTCGLQCLMYAKCAMVGEGPIVLVAVLLAQLPFYFATLEEFYTGALYLPIGNGITDGSLFLIALSFLIGALGSQPFTTQLSLFGLSVQASHLGFYLLCCSQIPFCLKNLHEILQAFFTPINTDEHYREPVNFLALFHQISSYLGITVVYFVFAKHSGADLTTNAPLLLSLQFSWIQVHQAMNVMLAHMTRSQFNPFNRLYIFHIFSITAILAAHHLFDVPQH